MVPVAADSHRTPTRITSQASDREPAALITTIPVLVAAMAVVAFDNLTNLLRDRAGAVADRIDLRASTAERDGMCVRSRCRTKVAVLLGICVWASVVAASLIGMTRGLPV